MMIDWMPPMIYLVMKVKFQTLVTKEIINLENQEPVVVLMIFNQLYSAVSALDSGCLENI